MGGRRKLTVQAIKQHDSALVLDYLQSKSNGAATMQELRYLCRRINMSGMAETIVDWLEQAGVVRYERSIEAVYLVRPTATSTAAALGEATAAAGDEAGGEEA